MKTITALIFNLLLTTGVFAQSVGINSDGSAPNSSAMLDVSSTTKGFLAPRMTKAQREAIFPVATDSGKGLLVYQTDDAAGYYYYNGSAWTGVSSSGTTLLNGGNTFGNSIYMGTNDNFGLNLLTNALPRFTISNAGSVALPAFTSAGVVHNDVTTGILSSSLIVNADINAAAGIADTKLATITTVGKVANSATTATDANTTGAIVARDASGNFAAGTITAGAVTSGGAVTGTSLVKSGGLSTEFLKADGSVDTNTYLTGTVAIANGGTGVTTKTTAFDALSPMTTPGDLILGGAGGTGTRLAKGTDGQILKMNTGGSAPVWSSQMLNNFTENRNATAPNVEKPAHQLITFGLETNIDMVITPKGNGGIMAQVPDNSISGGNKRGLGTVDLQMSRLNASQVASGDFSVISGGARNTASGIYSVIEGGILNITSNNFSTVCGGIGNTANGESSTVVGGSANIASGLYSFIGGGLNNTAPSFGEAVFGYYPTPYTPGTNGATQINLTDRLFVLGNGQQYTSPSNALTILKNANTTIGGALTLNGNGSSTSFTFPSTRPSTGNYLKASDDNGMLAWGAILADDIPTLNQNTTGTAANITGTVAIANGGTGATTAPNAINALLPSQSSNGGKYLSTDGTSASWVSPASAWSLTGNAFGTTTTNFIGTTDDNALVFKVNSQKAGEISLGSNTSFGYQTLNSNTGSYNTANGYQALYSNTTGNANTANGYNTLFTNTKGYSNAAFGQAALFSNTEGNYNTAIGFQALYFNTEGNSNTANGLQALYTNTTGISNTANGYWALYSNTTGNNNTANGQEALYSNTKGVSNTANGLQALYSNTTGEYNTAIGHEALFSNKTGNSNTANGYEAGRYIMGGGTNETSSNSVYLGASTKAFADGDQNEIVIGYDATGAGSNTVTLGNTSITSTVLRGDVTAKRYVLTQRSAIAASAATTIDLSAGNVFQVNLGANITTLGLTNPSVGTYLIKFTQDATGTRTVTFPAAWKWSGGIVPTITPTAGKTDIVTLIYDGTFYYAAIVQNF